jgi:ADP-ribose pyrophosphatase YjhB (NUDIX family)
MSGEFLIKMASSVFVEDDHGKILMVQEGKPECYGLWGQPGGHVEPGEDPLSTALREVKEETGYDVRILPGSSFVTYVCPRTVSAPYFINFCFRGTLKKHTRAPVLDPDVLDAAWYSPEELKGFSREKYRSALTFRRTTDWFMHQYHSRGFVLVTPEEMGKVLVP